MSQNHSTADGIPGWDQVDNPVLNTVGQYHGNVPWFYKFRAKIGIHYLVRTFPRTYATLPLQTRSCFVTYLIMALTGIIFIVTFELNCRYIILTSVIHRLLSKDNSASHFPSRTT